MGLPILNGNQLQTAITVAAVNIFNAACISIQSPFYPAEVNFRIYESSILKYRGQFVALFTKMKLSGKGSMKRGGRVHVPNLEEPRIFS